MRLLEKKTRYVDMVARYLEWETVFAWKPVPIQNGVPGEKRWLEFVWRKADTEKTDLIIKHGGPFDGNYWDWKVPFVYMAIPTDLSPGAGGV